MVGVDEVPSNSGLDKKVVKFSELNELAYKDLILSINTSSSMWKVTFGLVRNAKSQEFPQENWKTAWDIIVNKYAPHTASSLLKLRNEFHNSTLNSIEIDLEEWISNLEVLGIQMSKFRVISNISKKDIMIHILNRLPKNITSSWIVSRTVSHQVVLTSWPSRWFMKIYVTGIKN